MIGKRLYVFGGLEGNVRGDSMLCFDIAASTWEKIDCLGCVPCARAWHATTTYDRFLLVHGGEGETLRVAHDHKLFPGDDLDQASYKVMDFAGGSAQRSCLDDLWVFDTSRASFQRVNSQLAPLPRKHHGIAVADFEGAPHLFVFGGFSLERDAVSSGLFLLDMESVLAGHGTWRSAVTSGKPPAARQQHSLISVNEDTLLIYGGLGIDQTPLHDIVLLATDTMAWSHPNVGGTLPPPLFNHAAVIVNSATSSPQLLVFGGATSGSDKTVHYSSKLYTCDLATCVRVWCMLLMLSNWRLTLDPSLVRRRFEWEHVSTGYMFPAARVGHVFAVVHDWAPTHHAPCEQQPVVSDVSFGVLSTRLLC